MTITNPKAYLAATLLLSLMASLAITSMKDDSAIMDEVAHIPAGYSYLSEKDYRLNPEHPPLIKDFAALPLLFMKLNFPKDIKSWQNDINGQWDFGFNFLYRSGNDADKIIFWSRLPIVILALLLGIYVFKWTRELFGNRAGLIALFLYALSPTILAHSRFVTTDLAAAAGFFIATYYFIKFLKNPSKKNIILAGIVFGLVQLLKFSLFILIPYFGLLAILSIFSQKKIALENFKKLFKPIFRNLLLALLVFAIGYLTIYPFYQFHVWKYPPERQVRDTEFILKSYTIRPVADFIVWLANKPVLRAYGQYLLGLFMVFQRALGGNTTYFLGKISSVGWWYYFPVIYLLKVPLLVHLLTFFVLGAVIFELTKKPVKKSLSLIFKKHFATLAMFIFIAIYWVLSIRSNLNIGVRHILPTFPFLYVLVSGKISELLDFSQKQKILRFVAAGLFSLGALWYGWANFSVYPHYLAYFNELIGGAGNGYKYAVDSNLDWGQDLKRLAEWLNKNNIKKIKVDYFGGAEAEYYLKEKFIPLHSEDGAQKGWLAVSSTFYQTSRENPETSYAWLDKYEPVEKIGYSILVYYIE